MQRFLRALQFLTIIPAPRSSESATQDATLAASARFFPLVGLIIGVLSYFLFWVVSHWLPWRAGVLVLLAGSTILSGGLHVDGLSDFCDGFFSARGDREEVIRIMKDSRIGVMGALGIFFVLLLKYELLVLLASRSFLFFFTLAASRTVQVILAYFLPYVGGASGMGKGFVGEIARGDLVFAIVTTVILCLPLGLYVTIIELALLALFVYLFSGLVKKKVGGVTGDILGAASELSEIWILLVATWVMS